MITFSIVTCTFNAEHELQRTLDSVAEQSFQWVDHLILDGGSKDATVTLAKAYKQSSDDCGNGHTVTVVTEPDRGLYDAMNKGIAMAKGDYIMFLNAGDVFPSSETLEQVSASLADGEELPGVLYGDADIVNDEGRFLRHRRLRPPMTLTWKSFRQGMLVCHQSFYARTDLAKENVYDLQFRFSADVDWCIRVMKTAEKRGLTMRNVHAVLVNYLDGGMSIKHQRASLIERFKVMCRHYGLLSTVAMHLWFVVRAVIKR